MGVLAVLLFTLCSAPAMSDVTTVGIDTHDPRHVRAVYYDLLDRPPRKHERIAAARLEGDELVEALVGSLEWWENWYEHELFYFLLLDDLRPPDTSAEARLPAQLAADEIDVVEGLRLLCSAESFSRANPGNDTFVTVVLEQLLGLEVQRATAQLRAGKHMYDGRRASLWGTRGESQADVVRIAAAHEDFAPHFLSRQYERLFGIPPTRREFVRDVERFRSEPLVFTTLVTEWMLSDRYAEQLQELRPKTDRQFVRGLYVDLFGSVPLIDAEQRTRTALATMAERGPLRSIIARVLVARLETRLPNRAKLSPQQLVEDGFLRFYGRSPLPEELAEISAVYAQCDCPPEVVVLGLVTHPEYQHY